MRDPGRSKALGRWGQADALRSAVRELIVVEGPAEYAHPANWGAFVVFGMQS
ncbi:MAG: hypothetical protein LCH80_16065 [Proteobacteria bacterium]|nr:hypothetical protein [Pseudomonadota bacterium]